MTNIRYKRELYEK